MKYIQSKKGFTIIETSLVLAIAGLILVMAFVALPALQRQTRDAKRKEDAATFMQALTKYQENNRGQLPEYTINTSLKYDTGNITDWWEWNEEWSHGSTSHAWGRFYVQYLGDNFLRPDGEKYEFVVSECSDAGDVGYCADGKFGYGKSDSTERAFDNRRVDWFIYIPAICENGKPVPSSNKRNVAMAVMLETGGNICVDN